ncbi:hypothetical protein, partial [Inquilinus sp.]|uniref:hypothetical protein n=1 Tax=Inquilinus sp. TaxID=1932117 RepID=UPI0031D9B400
MKQSTARRNAFATSAAWTSLSSASISMRIRRRKNPDQMKLAQVQYSLDQTNKQQILPGYWKSILIRNGKSGLSPCFSSVTDERRLPDGADRRLRIHVIGNRGDR